MSRLCPEIVLGSDVRCVDRDSWKLLSAAASGLDRAGYWVLRDDPAADPPATPRGRGTRQEAKIDRMKRFLLFVWDLVALVLPAGRRDAEYHREAREARRTMRR